MKTLHWLSLGAMVAASASLVVGGCHSSTSSVKPDGGGGATATGSGGTTATGGGGTSGGGSSGYDGPLFGVDGQGSIPIGQTQCSNGKDDDNDGLIDYFDPECVGPLDNDESSFATGIPGDNIDACKQDCFFDGNSGMGDDGCLWQLKCDPKSTENKCPYDQQYAQQHTKECSVSSSQDQACINHCLGLVPNGCDCFGCCAVPGAATPIRLAATCTAADFNDPAKCPPCTQVTQCANPCERCELCIGKNSIPADCGSTGSGGAGGTPGTDSGTPPPPTPTCSNGYMPCGPGGIDPARCPVNTGCVTGCCIPTGIVP